MTNAATTLPPNTIRAHLLPGVDIPIDAHLRPCQIKRDWMNAIPQQYVYRCIPLLAANTMGWELLNPSESSVIWDGGDLTSTVRISTQAPGRFTAASHFGTGLVTWYVPFLFRTSPELGLLVTGPANQDQNDAVPLDAFIRTDWLPFPFTMSWRMTAVGRAVTFRQGEPIARIMPFPIAMLEETRLEIAGLESDPGFMAEVEAFGRAWQENVARQQADARRVAATGEALTGEGVWNAQYVKAKGKAGGGFARHQTVFKCADPVDVRGAAGDPIPRT